MNKTRRKEMHYLVAVVIIFFIAMFSHTEHYGYSDHILVRAFFGFLPNFIYIGLLSAWCVSIERRIINKQIKHFLMGTGILMIFWIAVRTVKWRFFSPFDVIGRYLWYCYYIPMILVPLLGVFIIICSGKSENYTLPKKMNFFFIPAFMLTAVVMTNDFHQLVFRFTDGIENYNDQYTYGFLFYVVIAWFVALGFYFVVMLLIKSRVPGSKTFQKMPVIIMVSAVVFWILYAFRLIFNVDLTAVDCLIIALLLESAIQSGLIRSNSGYGDLFRVSTVAAQIVDGKYNVCNSSAGAVELTTTTMKQAESGTVDLGDIQLQSRPISGGRVLWQEDICKIKELLEELEEAQERLSENNVLLKAELDIKERKARLDEKNRLYDRLIDEMSEQLIRADDLLKEAEKNPEIAKEALAQICVISAYIKRRGNLLLINEDNADISATELEFCMKESLDNMLFAGIITSLHSQLKNKIKTKHIVAFYDLFEKITEAYFDDMTAMLVNLKNDEFCIKMRVQIGCKDGFDETILSSFFIEDGEVLYNIQENDVTFDVTLPLGGDVQ